MTDIGPNLTMKTVARHLQEEAIRRTNNHDERDTFGRSAFNRYYYATFLNVKNALGSFKSDWNTIGHSKVPEVLRGKVNRELTAGRSRALKTNDHDTVAACSRAVTAANQLADLMEAAYATRVAADYQPEIKIDFSNLYDFELNTVHVKRASEWPDKAGGLIRTITLAWKQLHG